MNVAFLKKRKTLFILISCVLVIAEIRFSLFVEGGRLSQGSNAIWQFGVGIALGLAFLVWFYKRKIDFDNNTGKRNGLWFGITAILLVLGFGILAKSLYPLFLSNPIDAATSDIIPTLQVAVTRFLNHEMPYKTISKWGYDLPLTYLPLQWMPYIPAALLKFDYRWIAIGISAIASLFVVKRCARSGKPIGLLVTALLLYNLYVILISHESIFVVTIEIMIAGYYMGLILGISGKSPIIRGLVLSLCLLSRYSLVLWLPLWFVVEWISGSRKGLLTTVGVSTAVVLLVYILPFFVKDPAIFMNGYRYYTQAAIGEWHHVGENNLPYHLYAGNGFAHYYYERLTSYSIEDRIKSLQRTHLLLCLGSVTLMGIWYWFNRFNIDRRVFLMGSFKIYLSIFLAFIQVPYTYLMITGTFVSIAILAVLISAHEESEGDITHQTTPS